MRTLFADSGYWLAYDRDFEQAGFITLLRAS